MAIEFHKTGGKRFSIDQALYAAPLGRAPARRAASMPAPRRQAPVLRPASLPATPRTTWIGRLIARISAFLRDRAPAPAVVAVEQVAAPHPAPARITGATPTHYRAFSLLHPRLASDGPYSPVHPAIAAFRTRAKTIKEQGDQEVRGRALAVLDTFVKLVDAFTPLWDAAGDRDGLMLAVVGAGDRMGLRDDMLETVQRLDAELARILTPGEVDRDRFETVQRFVETRYGGDEADGRYGLGPVE